MPKVALMSVTAPSGVGLFAGLLFLFSFQISAAEVEFRGFIQAKYSFKQNLASWLNTANFLASELATPGASNSAIVCDEGPDSFLALLQRPPSNPNSYKILYFAAHVSPRGRIAFSDGAKVFPGELLSGDNNGETGWSPDVVIVDSCHSASFAYDRAWVDRFPCDHLFASDANQLACEIDLSLRQPLNYGGLYPEVIDHLTLRLGEAWDGKISDLGFRAAKTATKNIEIGLDGRGFLMALSLERREEKSSALRQSSILWIDASKLSELPAE